MSQTITPAVTHFVQTAALLAKHKGRLFEAAEDAASNRRVFRETAEILKAAVSAGSLSDPAWAGATHGYDWASDSFQESLRNIAVFDRLLAEGIRRVPLRARTVLTTIVPQAYVVDELAPKPVSQFGVSAEAIQPKKALAMLVLSNEVLKLVPNNGVSLIRTEMQNAVVASTDLFFLSTVVSSATSKASAGPTTKNVMTDVKWLLDTVAPKATGRPFLITSAATARTLATKTLTDGTLAFPTVTPFGGELAGVPLLVTDHLPNDSALVLIDTTAVIGDTDVITMRASEEGMIEMLDNPSNPSTSATVYRSLYQTNCTALLLERYFGFRLERAAGVAAVTGVNYQDAA
ncbi:MAG TPA: phage major capsid protein [Pseudoxanthomonas sp.]|nr:phage major capsid protein [Pseudoxanthomonas sp.]